MVWSVCFTNSKAVLCLGLGLGLGLGLSLGGVVLVSVVVVLLLVGGGGKDGCGLLPIPHTVGVTVCGRVPGLRHRLRQGKRARHRLLSSHADNVCSVVGGSVASW